MVAANDNRLAQMGVLRCAGLLCAGKNISGAKKNTSDAVMNSTASTKVVNSARMDVSYIAKQCIMALQASNLFLVEGLTIFEGQ
jgi:hypothetical protein